MTDFYVPEVIGLIETTRLKAIPKISLRKAASKANISHTRWQQTTQGYKVRYGEKIQMEEPTIDIIAQMAYGVDIKPKELKPLNQAASEYLEKIYKGEIKLKLSKTYTKQNKYRQFIQFVESHTINNKQLTDKQKEKIIENIETYITTLIEYSEIQE